MTCLKDHAGPLRPRGRPRKHPPKPVGRRRGGQPGNRNRWRHGAFSRAAKLERQALCQQLLGMEFLIAQALARHRCELRWPDGRPDDKRSLLATRIGIGVTLRRSAEHPLERSFAPLPRSCLRRFIGLSMSKPRRCCIYCGGHGLTKEHIFADWLREYIPRELAEHHMASTITFPHKSQTIVRRRTGDTHARRLRRVCGVCNSGWMSRLQNAAKPFLVPMLQGATTKLNRNAMKTVAAWITMTAMTAEYVDEEMVAVSQSERDWLRETGLPPRSWRIWIGRSGPMTKTYWHHVMALTDRVIHRDALYVPHPPNTQTTAIRFGRHLFVYMMSSDVTRAQDIIRRWSFPASAAPSLRQIWPAAASGVRWPLGSPLKGAEIEYIAGDFYSRIERSMRKATGT